ncbi:orotidine-5'-phosphate decarboxylase [Verticiella sediminum]|uniref:Orotidine 5'-phosphate decarboxylase n=1 Tax=Verticiella sediminum TaxID=1247510 RepID=A0A556AXC8_9BURK|nr:orotidine-5'-phosphate decarboxylase [Verticiella sediminum]TSH97600.1 orotidine-5'-phosphate decarboxylase [Verticiella sediminum]
MTFLDKLDAAWAASGSLLTVGLDPDLSRLPAELRGRPDAVLEFCREIVDATAAYACAFKPQIAYFAAEGAEEQLEAICRHIREKHPGIPIVLDAKRGDIGPTAAQYAREAFERYRADAVTVNPYMGYDSVAPYLDWRDRAVFVLCRTSNPGGSDLQFLTLEGEPLYLRVARLTTQVWRERADALDGQLGLVVGATFPDELAKVRATVGAGVPILVPGVGAQGGSVPLTVQAGLDTRGTGLLINSSRAILYAPGEDWRAAAAAAARDTRDAINAARIGAPA